jgi:hypothetical protein
MGTNGAPVRWRAALAWALAGACMASTLAAQCDFAEDAMGFRYIGADTYWHYFTAGDVGVQSRVVVTGWDGQRNWSYWANVYTEARRDELLGEGSPCGPILSTLLAQSTGWAVVGADGRSLPDQRIPLAASDPGSFGAFFTPVAHLCAEEGTDIADGDRSVLVGDDGVALPLLGLSAEQQAGLTGFGAKVAAELAAMAATEVKHSTCSFVDGRLQLSLRIKDRDGKKQDVVIAED